MMSGLLVEQQGQKYSVYTPHGILIAQLFLGQDGQILKDVEALTPITKALAKRWGVESKKR